MAERIPEEWKRAVVDILKEGDLDRIEIRETTARIPFDSLFPGAFTHELLDAFLDGLDDDEIELGVHLHPSKEEDIREGVPDTQEQVGDHLLSARAT